MKNTLETRLGLFFALALVAAFIVMEMVGSFDFLKPGVRVRAQFDSVQELTPGDPVKMGGKQIGRVEQVSFVNNRVQVLMKIRGEDAASVHIDSKASIRFSGLLGQNYVSLTFGQPTSSPVFNDRDQPVLLQSIEQPDFSSLISKLDSATAGITNLAGSFGGDQIQKLLGPMLNFVEDNQTNLTGIISNVHLVTARVAASEGTVGKLINTPELHDAAVGTVSNLNLTAADLRTAIKNATNLLHRVQQGEGTVGKLMTDPTLFNQLTNAAGSLNEILAKVNQGTGTVSQILNDPALYKNVRVSLQKLDKATESLEDQGPLSVIGIAVGHLF